MTTYTNVEYLVHPDNTENKLMIKVDIDGITSSVPLQPGNRHYDEIMRLVESGELTIADAE